MPVALLRPSIENSAFRPSTSAFKMTDIFPPSLAGLPFTSTDCISATVSNEVRAMVALLLLEFEVVAVIIAFPVEVAEVYSAV
jgi:hypothetical protein